MSYGMKFPPPAHITICIAYCSSVKKTRDREGWNRRYLVCCLSFCLLSSLHWNNIMNENQLNQYCILLSNLQYDALRALHMQTTNIVQESAFACVNYYSRLLTTKTATQLRIRMIWPWYSCSATRIMWWPQQGAYVACGFVAFNCHWIHTIQVASSELYKQQKNNKWHQCQRF